MSDNDEVQKIIDALYDAEHEADIASETGYFGAYKGIQSKHIARALNSLKTQWQAEALQEAAEDIELGDWSHHGNKTDRHNAEAEASTWLEKRAALIEGDTGA